MIDDVVGPMAVFIAVLVSAATLAGGVSVTVRQVVHHIDVSVCRTFADQSGYETKFVDYNLVSWDCLARAADGKWVSKDQLRDVQ